MESAFTPASGANDNLLTISLATQLGQGAALRSAGAMAISYSGPDARELTIVVPAGQRVTPAPNHLMAVFVAESNAPLLVSGIRGSASPAVMNSIMVCDAGGQPAFTNPGATDVVLRIIYLSPNQQN